MTRNAHGYATTLVVLGVCFVPFVGRPIGDAMPIGRSDGGGEGRVLIFPACIPNTAARGLAGYIGIERMNYVKTSELLTLITTTGQLNE